MSELPIDDAKSLIQAIADLARMADRALPATATKLTQRLRDHLGELDVVPNTSVALDPIERANVQLALDEVRATSAVWEEFGLAPDVGNSGGVSFPSLIAGNWHGPGETARQFMSVDISTTETVKCLRADVILCTSGDAPVAVMIYQTQRHREGTRSGDRGVHPGSRRCVSRAHMRTHVAEERVARQSADLRLRRAWRLRPDLHIDPLHLTSRGDPA